LRQQHHCRRSWATSLRHSTASSSSSTTGATASSAPGKLSFPLILFPWPAFPSACRTFVLHAGGWGGNNSPRWFLVLRQTCSGPASLVDGPGWSWPSPAFWAGSGPEENISFLGRDRPNPFWTEIGPTPLGWVRPSWLGRISPAHLILYIIYIIFCIIYIDIYLYIWKITKILQKLF